MKTKTENINFFDMLQHRKPVGNKMEGCREIVQLLNTVYTARIDLEKDLLTSDAFYYQLLDYAEQITQKHITIKDLLFRGNYSKTELKSKLGAFLLNLKLFKEHVDNNTLGLRDQVYEKWVLFGFNTNKINAFKINVLNKKIPISDWLYNRIYGLNDIIHQASNRLVEIYAPLAVDVARKKGILYSDSGEITADWSDDLTQAGLMGLYIAAQHWDPTKAASFTTYAWYWIASEFAKFYNKKELVDLPRNVLTLRNKINKISTKFGIVKSNVSDFKPFMKNYSDKAIENAMQQEGCISINDMVAEEYEPEEKGIEEITDGQDIEKDVYILTNKDIVNKLIKQILKKKERIILEKRFGLNGRDEHTYIDLAAEYKMTNEGARQYVLGCLQKLTPAFVKTFGEDYGEEDTHKVLNLHRKKK